MTIVYRDHVRDALRELSSIQMQTRLWLSAGEPEWSSPEEAICRLFDDSGLSVAFEKQEPVFGQAADQQLRHLETQLRTIDLAKSPDEIIEDPAMEQIRVIARQLLRDLFNE